MSAIHLTIPIIIGWLGTFSYILAYLLLILGKIRAERSFYHILNILGAIGLMVNAVHFGDYPNVIVNLVWLGIALAALVMIVRKRVRGN
jgi:hypothetical protein